MTPGQGEKGEHLGDVPGPAQPSRGAAGARVVTGAGESPARVAVSRCLLGDAVRHDGVDRSAAGLATLARRWRVVAYCPEVAAGLGVPRPPIDLVGPVEALRVVDRAAGVDVTAPLEAAIAAFVAAAAPLDGAVVKARSPSCGIGDARRYDHADDPAEAGRADGRFVAALRALDPPPALIDEAGLTDRDAFVRFSMAVELRRRARLDLAALVAELAPWIAARGGEIGDITMSADHRRIVRHIDVMMNRTAIDDAPPALHATATVAAADHLTIDSRIAAPRRDFAVRRRETKAGFT